MDEDLQTKTCEELVAEVKKLRAAIREHRDSSGHALCWYHPQLWSLLPEQSTQIPVVSAWPQFMRGCIAYRQPLDEQCPGAAISTEEFKA